MEKRELNDVKFFTTTIFKRRPKYILYSPQSYNSLLFTTIPHRQFDGTTLTIDHVVHKVSYSKEIYDLIVQYFKSFSDTSKCFCINAKRVSSIINANLKNDMLDLVFNGDFIYDKKTYLSMKSSPDELDSDDDSTSSSESTNTNDSEDDSDLSEKDEDKFLLKYISVFDYDSMDSIITANDYKPKIRFEIDTEAMRGKELNILKFPVPKGEFKFVSIDAHNGPSIMECRKKYDSEFKAYTTFYQEMLASRNTFEVETKDFSSISIIPANLNLLRKPQNEQ